jgi:hypothetical protein
MKGIVVTKQNTVVKLDLVEKAPGLVVDYGVHASFEFNSILDWPGAGVQRFSILSARIQRQKSLNKKNKKEDNVNIQEMFELIELLTNYGLQDPKQQIQLRTLTFKEQVRIIDAFSDWVQEESKKKEAELKK